MSLLAPPQDVLALLHETLPEGAAAPEEEEILSYVAFLAAALAEANQFDATVWKDTVAPYLAESTLSQVTAETAEAFRLAVQNAFTDEDDADSYGGDDDGEEVCNLRFNLAYGGKILLHNTKLRLLRGRRYVHSFVPPHSQPSSSLCMCSRLSSLITALPTTYIQLRVGRTERGRKDHAHECRTQWQD
jgi:hypothetical protein